MYFAIINFKISCSNQPIEKIIITAGDTLDYFFIGFGGWGWTVFSDILWFLLQLKETMNMYFLLMYHNPPLSVIFVHSSLPHSLPFPSLTNVTKQSIGFSLNSWFPHSIFYVDVCIHICQHTVMHCLHDVSLLLLYYYPLPNLQNDYKSTL